MNENNKKRSIVVGLFVILGIVFLLAGILMIGNIHETFTKKIKLTTLFDDVSGLQVGNNIWFSGVKIGIVKQLRFYGKSQVEVTMKIDINAQQYIRKDALVKIGTDGLIGNKILIIYGGSSTANEVHEGDTLAVAKTFSSEDMIDMLQENNKNVLQITTDFKSISQNLLNGHGSIGKLLQNDSIYNNINASTQSLQMATANANKLIHTLNDFSEGLNQKGTFANDIVNDTVLFYSFRQSAKQLQQVTDKANSLVENLNSMSANPNSSFGVLMHDEVTGIQLKKTVQNLESSSKKLEGNLDAIQHSFLLRRYFRKKAEAVEEDKK